MNQKVSKKVRRHPSHCITGATEAVWAANLFSCQHVICNVVQPCTPEDLTPILPSFQIQHCLTQKAVLDDFGGKWKKAKHTLKIALGLWFFFSKNLQQLPDMLMVGLQVFVLKIYIPIWVVLGIYRTGCKSQNVAYCTQTNAKNYLKRPKTNISLCSLGKKTI